MLSSRRAQKLPATDRAQPDNGDKLSFIFSFDVTLQTRIYEGERLLMLEMKLFADYEMGKQPLFLKSNIDNFSLFGGISLVILKVR